MPMTVDEVHQIFDLIRANWPNAQQMTEITQSVWCEKLADQNIGTVRRALDDIANEGGDFPPVIGQLVKRIRDLRSRPDYVTPNSLRLADHSADRRVPLGKLRESLPKSHPLSPNRIRPPQKLRPIAMKEVSPEEAARRERIETVFARAEARIIAEQREAFGDDIFDEPMQPHGSSVEDALETVFDGLSVSYE